MTAVHPAVSELLVGDGHETSVITIKDTTFRLVEECVTQSIKYSRLVILSIDE
jgi:hypothetical protein